MEGFRRKFLEFNDADGEYGVQLKALMRLVTLLESVGEGVLGKGGPAMMYQAGLDTGKADGAVPGKTDDLDRALAMIGAEWGDGVWRMERWRDPGEGEWSDRQGRKTTWLLMRSCPILTLGRRTGVTPGGLLCQSLHGYMAGRLGQMMDCRVDLRISHCGPRACKLLLEVK